jgi:hypothetical protein
MASKVVQDLFMACDQKNAKQKIDEVISKCVSFKIGKTGMTLEKRGNSPDYAGKYKWIKPLYENSNPDEVSKMEAYLINYYIHWTRCDNEKDGVSSIHDEMKDGADKYYVYIVWK